MYREKIKVLDCTIRDGGLINNHYFTDEFVRSVYKALTKSGIDYMEFGYRSSRELYPPEDYGAWKYCDDDKIQSNTDSKGHTGLHDTYAAGSRVGLYNSLYGHRHIKRASSLCDSISKNGRQGKIRRVLRANARNSGVGIILFSTNWLSGCLAVVGTTMKSSTCRFQLRNSLLVHKVSVGVRYLSS